MGKDAWREDQPLRRTTFEDLQLTISCSTRLGIVIALARGHMDVNQLGTRLKFSQSLLSNHLKVLREAGFVDFDRDGGRHLYHITNNLQVGIDSGGVSISLHAGDRSVLSANIPLDSPTIRQLQAALGPLLLDGGGELR